ncbi:MAG: hypothetical protein OEW48_00495 [Phycisphaerae bacterium]|nr:hypothetical protein [Phycisphaerae bacterium]
MNKGISGLVSMVLPVLVLAPSLPGLAEAVRFDLIKDGRIDWSDLAGFAEKWLDTGCLADYFCGGADFDYSDRVDFTDFNLLAVEWGSVEPYVTNLLAGHEPYETHVGILGPHPTDPSVTIGARLLGGTNHPTFGIVPTATEGRYVLGLTWDNETDRKVEYGYNFTGGFTFDLAGVDEIVFDVFVPTGGLLFPAGLVGVWDATFGWNKSANVPTSFDKWHTVVVDVVDRNNVGLGGIGALVFEDMGGPGDIAGTLFVDNLRLRRINPDYYNLTATGHDSRIDLRWRPVKAPSLEGYNIYRADSSVGPFTKLNSSVHTVSVYSDFLGVNGRTVYYYITSVLDGGETAQSGIVSATSYAMTDEQLLTSVQEAVFRYFWDFGHPVSGLARERFYVGDRRTVTTGGSGFGLMAIVVGVDRGFVSRIEAAERILKILTFLDEKAARYHGAWSHWFDGTTGEPIAFDYDEFGNPIMSGDLVETAFMIQGMLAVRQYFDSDDTVETSVRSMVTKLWQDVEWDWYRRAGDTDGNSLWWLWSPTHNWQNSFRITGYNECMVAYLLAIASPAHPIPPSCYYDGWARESWYANGDTFYGYYQWVGPDYGGPLFWTHYSFLGFDPRNKSDNYCNYFNNSRNISLINRAHCINNPNNFAGYSASVWGLTASCNPWGYLAHSPTNDNGTITPTAALSAMPFTPAESIATLKHFYHVYGDRLWGPFGFYDAFNLQENWFSDAYLAIDQGPIVVMIENYRTQLCWDLFMANPEIMPMLAAIGWGIGPPPPP